MDFILEGILHMYFYYFYLSPNNKATFFKAFCLNTMKTFDLVGAMGVSSVYDDSYKNN